MKRFWLVIYFLLCFSFIFSSCDFPGSSGKDFENKEDSYLILPTSVKEIEENKESAKDLFLKNIDEINNVEVKNFKNVAYALNDALYVFSKTIDIYDLTSNLSTDQNLRDSASEAANELKETKRSIYFNNNLYDSIRFVLSDSSDLSPEEKRLCELFIQNFDLNGVNLNSTDQELLKEINSEIASFCTEFDKNVMNYDGKVLFTEDELEGVPESELANLSKDDSGNYIMDPRTSAGLIVIRTYAKKEAARKKAYTAYSSVAKDKNPEIFERIVQLRAKEAAVLGFDSFADLSTSSKMAKKGSNAMAFLENLILKSKNKFELEKKSLLNLKKTDTNNDNAVLNLWDIAYYQNIYNKKNFDLNHLEMKKYFSLDNCIKGVFENFEKVLNLNITKLDIPKDKLWHEDVTAYQVSDKSSSEVLGIFYLDLYPRDGKYNHFAVSFTRLGNVFLNGKKEIPAGVLIGNWQKPEKDKPSLLTFSEMKDLFHEFGHTMNLLLMDSKFSNLRMYSWDFVEVPSIMAEQWAFDRNVLETFARNVENPEEVVPADYIEKIKKSDNAFSGSFVAAQAGYSIIDLKLHSEFKSTDSIDVTKVFNDGMDKYYFAEPENTSYISRFTHFTGGYEAGYYSYLWSFAIVYDLKTLFDESPDGMLDKEAGLKLRENIYEPGLKRDENESVRAFLGRDWNVDAYINYISSGAE